MPENKSLARLEQLLFDVLSPGLARAYTALAQKAVVEARECEPPPTPEECAAADPLFRGTPPRLGVDGVPGPFHSGENRRAEVFVTTAPADIASRLRALCDDPAVIVLIDYDDGRGNLTTDREIVPREYVEGTPAFIRATDVRKDENRTFRVSRIIQLTVGGWVAR